MSLAEKYTISHLEQQSYRQLQKTAKNLNLPANVKKACLVQLIHTSYFGSPLDVLTVVEDVKRERKQNSQTKKRKNARRMGLEDEEVSSSTAEHIGHADRSPGIGETPKRFSTPFGRYTPVNRPNLLKYTPSPSIVRQRSTTNPASATSKNYLKTYPSPKQVICDRVLRNRRQPIYSKADSPKPQNYRDVVSSNDRAIELNEKQIPERNDRVKVVNRNEKGYRKNEAMYKVQSKALEPKHRPAILSAKVSPLSNGPRRAPYKMDTYNSNQRIGSSIRAANAPIEPTTSNLTHPEIKPAKRQRRILSGIYPLNTKVPKASDAFEYEARDLSIRKKDGTYTKISALVQKPRAVPPQNINTRAAKENSVQNTQKEPNFECTIQDIIDDNIDNIPFTIQETPESYVDAYNGMNYPNTCPVTYEFVSPTQYTHTNYENTAYGLDTPLSMNGYQPNNREPQNDLESFDEFYSTYYHKKIRRRQSLHAEEARAIRESLHSENVRARCESLQTEEIRARLESLPAEQVWSRRESLRAYKQPTESNEQLPSMHEAFSSFVTEPTTVQNHTVASLETPSYTTYSDHHFANMNMSDMNFYYMNQYLNNQPFVQIEPCAGAVTRSIYTTPMVATATVGGASTNGSNNVIMPADIYYSNDTIIYEELPPATEIMQIPESNDYGCTTACVHRTGSQMGDIHSECTESDLEDALDYISQDGEYLRGMGLAADMHCMVCPWAGPIIKLEQHITQAQHYVHKFDPREWNVTFSLGALLSSGLWHSEVVEGSFEKYILSVKAARGILEATLTTLSVMDPEPKNGTVTIYNAVSGEPHIWNGIIPPLPSTLPHENTTANKDKLKVRLDKLDILPRSGCDKVVYGPPDYENIQITVFVRIVKAE